MPNEQHKHAYALLLKKAQQAAREAGEDALKAMYRAIDAASEKEEALAALTRQELDEIKKTLKADLEAIARYFEEVGEGMEEILTADAAYLEEKFLEASEQLADPSILQLARMRLIDAARLEKMI
jgi:hypothetical protein